jgi:PAS domain S-box-containing protein
MRKIILHSAVPIRDEGGNVKGAIVVNQEITERARMGEALRRYHEELEERVRERTRELFDLTEKLQVEIRQRRDAEDAAIREQAFRETIEDSLIAGLIAVDTEGRILSVNDAFCAMTGWSEEELLGTSPPHGFWAPEEIKTIAAARKTLGKDLPLVGQEFVLRRRSGERFPALVYVSPFRDPDGTLKGYVGSVTDITERKRAETEYRTILRTAMDGFWVSDNEGRFLDANDAACRHLGYDREELLGGMRIQDIEAAESAEETAARIRKIREEGHDRFETRHLRQDGRIVHAEVSANYTDTGGGRYFVFIRDITERKELERMALIQEKMASLGQLAAGIAHEIRNPLSGINISISSIVHTCAKSEGLEPELRERIRLIVEQMTSAAEKIGLVVQRVMGFSRPAPLRLEDVDLNALIEEAILLSSSMLRSRGIVVLKDLAPDLPNCRADHQLMEQVLINLITNACQAMEGMGGAKRLEIASGVRDGRIVLRVSDSGPGVPEAIREKIFDPFFTTKKEGTGIGLALTHRILSDHGGVIRVGTSDWGGALFTIGLPAGDERDISAV